MSISKQKTSLFFKLSISITVFSALFKFLPTSLTILGAAGMLIFLSIQFYQKEQRAALDYARLLLIASFSNHCAFTFFGSPYGHVFISVMQLALIVFLILYIKKIIMSLQDMTQNNTLLLGNFGGENLSYLLADLATVYIVIAALFKILHWEFGIINGNLLLLIGFFTALVSILTSPKGLRS